MAASFGIYVGSSTTCVAVNKDGQTAVLANDAGDRVTYAVVSYTDGELSVGLFSRNPSNNMNFCKRLIGRPNLESSDVANVVARSLCKIGKSSNGDVFYEVLESDGKCRKFNAQNILSLIYKQLKETATSHSGVQGARTAVLVVSTQFTAEQTSCLKQAASSAGFKVLQVIREPAAALLAYDVGQETGDPSSTALSNEYCVVYRVGGTSLDATVVSVSDGLYRIRCTAHRSDLGGSDVTERLTSMLADEFRRRYKVDVSDKPRSMLKLRNAAEESKRVLSTLTTMTCSVESLHDGIDFTCPLSRSRCEIVFSSLLPQFLSPLQEVLDEANLKVEDVNKVVLCGGTCKIPQLQQAVAQFFKSAQLLCSFPADEVLAIGAANQASLLKGEEANYGTGEMMYPALTRSIFYAISDKSDKTDGSGLVFDIGTIVPARKELKIPLNGRRNNISIDVYEQIDSSARNLLTNLTLDDLPDSVGEVTAEFHATKENSLVVRLIDKLTGKTELATVCRTNSN